MEPSKEPSPLSIASRMFAICLATFLLSLYFYYPEGGTQVFIFVSGLMVGSCVASVGILWWLTRDYEPEDADEDKKESRRGPRTH